MPAAPPAPITQLATPAAGEDAPAVGKVAVGLGALDSGQCHELPRGHHPSEPWVRCPLDRCHRPAPGSVSACSPANRIKTVPESAHHPPLRWLLASCWFSRGTLTTANPSSRTAL